MKDRIEKFLIYIIFMVVCVIMICQGIITISTNKGFYKNSIKTKGTIVYISPRSRVKAEIIVDDKKYTADIGEYNSNMKVGDEITVYYNKDNPSEFKPMSSGYVGYILVLFGIIVMVDLIIRMKKEIQYLKEERKNDRGIYKNRK